MRWSTFLKPLCYSLILCAIICVIRLLIWFKTLAVDLIQT